MQYLFNLDTRDKADNNQNWRVSIQERNYSNIGADRSVNRINAGT